VKVCFLSVGPVEDEPRVRRQASALVKAGYEVVAIGAAGGRSSKCEFPVVALDLPSLRGVRRAVGAAAQLVSAVGGGVARWVYWVDPRRRQMLRAALEQRADVYVAREWRTLPIAIRAKSKLGSGVAFDAPELSAEENPNSRVWRTFFRPMVVAIERRFLREAALITVVGGEIGSRISQAYDLDTRPVPVRNVPNFEHHDVLPVTDGVEVLFLGGIVARRGLEQLIDSVGRWPHGWRLTIKGPSAAAYLAELQQRAAPMGDVVRFEGPAPLLEVVDAASRYHVGIFAHQPAGPQSEYALPNKLFEYLMAGLAVCVSDMTSMREIVERWGCGVLIAAPYSSKEIAMAVNHLATGDLATFQAASLAASKELNWDRESERYVDAFAAAFGPGR
jgi:glycogen synthase